MLSITIPVPCHEDWGAMSASSQGRFCNSCEKTVVDFTTMSDEEVRNYLVNKKDEKLCGRFSSMQLGRIKIHLPENVFQLSMPEWKRFLLACLVVFSTTLFSCDITNDTINKQIGETNVVAQSVNDTVPEFSSDRTVGMISYPLTDTVESTEESPDLFTGDIEIARPADQPGIVKGEIGPEVKMENVAPQEIKLGSNLYKLGMISIQRRNIDTSSVPVIPVHQKQDTIKCADPTDSYQ
ncbi:MAG: hypothetical protein ABIQ56_03670 [Chitinophagaceae bacterium]